RVAAAGQEVTAVVGERQGKEPRGGLASELLPACGRVPANRASGLAGSETAVAVRREGNPPDEVGRLLKPAHLHEPVDRGGGRREFPEGVALELDPHRRRPELPPDEPGRAGAERLLKGDRPTHGIAVEVDRHRPALASDREGVEVPRPEPRGGRERSDPG